MSKQQVVAVVDPITGGHHLGYIRLITKAFIELGHEVWVFYPEATREVLPWIREEGHEASVKVFDLTIQKKLYPRLKQFAHATATLQLWLQVKTALRQAEQKVGQQIHNVFFAWLDSFLANYLPYQVVDTLFDYKWSGLYFHPMFLLEEKSTVSSISSIDYVLKSKRCNTVFLQDEFLTEQLRCRIGKTVAYFPQITDQALPERDFYLCKEIKSKAAGRKIVGLIGLDKRKGLLSFIDLIRASDPERFYFFMAGPIIDLNYTEEEVKHINTFIDCLPVNCYYYRDYLKEGPQVNAVIDALDIVYQVYYRFRSASNFTTKAAFLKKPVLAKNSDWIGKVAKKYSLGITVPENDVTAIAYGLVTLDDLIKKGLLNPDYKNYLDRNSYQALKEAMHTIIP